LRSAIEARLANASSNRRSDSSNRPGSTEQAPSTPRASPKETIGATITCAKPA
jgi:hypothetical protein